MHRIDLVSTEEVWDENRWYSEEVPFRHRNNLVLNEAELLPHRNIQALNEAELLPHRNIQAWTEAELPPHRNIQR